MTHQRRRAAHARFPPSFRLRQSALLMEAAAPEELHRATPEQRGGNSTAAFVAGLNWLRQVGPIVPNIADHFADRPDFQRRVRARLEQRHQVVLGRRSFTQPFRPVGFVQNDRHPVMQFAHRTVAAEVRIVQLNTCSPSGDFHFAHRPAMTNGALSAMAIA